MGKDRKLVPGEGLRIFAQTDICRNGIALYGFSTPGGEKVASVNMSEHEEFSSSEPFVWLETSQAQALADRLWECGIRPTEGTGSAGSLAATQYHLEDMRRLVFKDG